MFEPKKCKHRWEILKEKTVTQENDNNYAMYGNYDKDGQGSTVGQKIITTKSEIYLLVLNCSLCGEIRTIRNPKEKEDV